jgi:hypothetical protein
VWLPAAAELGEDVGRRDEPQRDRSPASRRPDRRRSVSFFSFDRDLSSGR